jgi:hypothetical protein
MQSLDKLKFERKLTNCSINVQEPSRKIFYPTNFIDILKEVQENRSF